MSANATSNSSLCYEAGGLWPAIEAFIAFLVTNIIAHAASIFFPEGWDLFTNVKAILSSIFLPVFAGDTAFHSLNRWITRLIHGKVAFADLFGGGTFEDAAVSGVVAISVPLRFAPILAGKWDLATRHQGILMLNNHNYWSPASPDDIAKLSSQFPFKPSGHMRMYVAFILPPTTRFPGYTDYSLSPTTSWLPQIIALVQAVLSSRSLYLNYSTSIVTDGLSSPYIVVIPYIFMSLVNILTNTLVTSYTQITMLPMAVDQLPKENMVFIAGPDTATPEKYRLRVLRLKQTQQPAAQVTTLGPSDEVEKGMVATAAQPVQEVAKDSDLEEFTGTDYIPFLTPDNPVKGPFQSEKQVLNLGLFHIIRKDTWTSVCWDLQYRCYFGTKPKLGITAIVDSPVKASAAFLRQRFLYQFNWRLMNGPDFSKYPPQSQITEFRTWLNANYPGVEIPLDDLNPQLWQSALVGGIILQVLVTVIVAALTRFQVDNPSHAAWFLIWLYGSSALRCMWLISTYIYSNPCESVWKWLCFWCIVGFEICLAGAMGCAITVLLVDLFETFCIPAIPIEAGVWVLIGVLVIVAFAIATAVIVNLERIVTFFANLFSKLFAKKTQTNQPAPLANPPVT